MFSIWGAKQHAARTREAAHHLRGGGVLREAEMRGWWELVLLGSTKKEDRSTL